MGRPSLFGDGRLELSLLKILTSWARVERASVVHEDFSGQIDVQ